MRRGIDKCFLEKCLADGMSLPEIGRLVGRPAGTVGYWVKRHGLVANGHDRYTAKGSLERETLQILIDQGRSVREIANDLGTSSSRVRYWIAKHGLGVNRLRKRRIADARSAGSTEVSLDCPKHGYTEFWLGRSKVRCKKCNAECVANRRRKVKQILVAESGGRCRICGYEKSQVALQFHHLDPETKLFGIAGDGKTISLRSARVEAAKCILLCANCHAEVEAGIVGLD